MALAELCFRRRVRLLLAATLSAVAACGPTARIPGRPVAMAPTPAPASAPMSSTPVRLAAEGAAVLAEALATAVPASAASLRRLRAAGGEEVPGVADEEQTTLAQALAPVLFRHARDPFPLSRAVAVVHPERRVIAYHLLWQDDAYGAWLPGTVPTDEEIVWVGYDATGAPTEMWTYWHGVILHTPWERRQVAVDVQWGKHGSLPRGLRLEDLPRWRSMRSFYAITFALPDFWLGNVTRKGPWCFCGNYRDYLTFDTPQRLGDSLDAVVVADDPRSALGLVFGAPYSNKPWWPWLVPESKRVKVRVNP